MEAQRQLEGNFGSTLTSAIENTLHLWERAREVLAEKFEGLKELLENGAIKRATVALMVATALGVGIRIGVTYSVRREDVSLEWERTERIVETRRVKDFSATNTLEGDGTLKLGAIEPSHEGKPSENELVEVLETTKTVEFKLRASDVETLRRFSGYLDFSGQGKENEGKGLPGLSR